MDWGGLIAITMCVVFGWFSWRWSVPYNVSIYKMVRAKEPEPESWFLKVLRVGRWLSVAFFALMILFILAEWTPS